MASSQLFTKRTAIVSGVGLVAIVLVVGASAEERTTTLRTAGSVTGIPGDADPGGPALDELDLDNLAVEGASEGDAAGAADRGRESFRGVQIESSSASFRCQFDQLTDGVRSVRRADGTRIIRSSGWWRNGNCPSAIAQVTVQLQVKIDGRWRDVGDPASVTTSARRARSQPAAVQHVCARSADGPGEWRSVTEVDLVDQPDANDLLVTPTARLSCPPPG